MASKDSLKEGFKVCPPLYHLELGNTLFLTKKMFKGMRLKDTA
jgi:hypothetical protein